ncbi:MAG: head maturation protease, ClpP-related [Corynebacterium sp.]|uniref:head maturation protease, ClpP-related n=1 Tax=Corynebacterium sp. TaxID=1720 RepID=UPI003F0D6E7F
MNELLIYGEIGWEVQPFEVARILGEMEGDLTVRVNSPGGDVHDGHAIMNALRGYSGSVTVIIEGLAASAASYIAIGGADRVIIRPSAELMIHDAWTYADGNAAAMEKVLADLNRISTTMSEIYSAKAGGTPDEWRDIMRAETWYTAAEALDAGLVDAVEDARAVAAAVMPRNGIMANFRYSGRRDAPAPTTHRPTGHNRKEGGMSALADLAREMGHPETKVKAALARFLAEEVQVTSIVEVTYPEDTTVVPTGSATITPTGEVPPGLTFAIDTTPEGWTAEVDEATGVLTVTAPSGAEPDDEVEVTVTATGTEAVTLTAKITVKAAAGEGDSPATGDPAVTDPETLTSVIDSSRLAELEEAAAYGWKAMERDREEKAKAFAEAAFRANKIGAAARKRWAAAWVNDREDAEARMAQIPSGTVHRGEDGHARTDQDTVATAETERDERVRRSLIR